MSLFVRVNLAFWQHRKTLRLRAMIGDAAFWVPPRLWSYAAANQPDGNFSDYMPEEIASVIGYAGDAIALLEALQKSGFLDGHKIHDWEEHNGYHSTFASRAKKAATARWKKADQQKKGNEKEKRGEEKRQALLQAMLKHEQGGESSFDSFWKAYPRRVGKASAEKAWKKNGCNAIAEQVLAAIARCGASADWQKDGGQFIPYPATWINRRGWEDDFSIAPLPAAKRPVGVYLAPSSI